MHWISYLSLTPSFSFTHIFHIYIHSYFSIPSLSYLVDPLVLITIKKNMVLRPLEMSTLLDCTLSCYISHWLPLLILHATSLSFHCLSYMLSFSLLPLLIQNLLYMAIFPSLGPLEESVLEGRFHLLHIPHLSIFSYPPAFCSIISYTLLDIGRK